MTGKGCRHGVGGELELVANQHFVISKPEIVDGVGI